MPQKVQVRFFWSKFLWNSLAGGRVSRAITGTVAEATATRAASTPCASRQRGIVWPRAPWTRRSCGESTGDHWNIRGMKRNLFFSPKVFAKESWTWKMSNSKVHLKKKKSAPPWNWNRLSRDIYIYIRMYYNYILDHRLHTVVVNQSEHL